MLFSAVEASAMEMVFIGGGVCGFEPSSDDPCEVWGSDGAGECEALAVALTGADIDEGAEFMSSTLFAVGWGELDVEIWGFASIVGCTDQGEVEEARSVRKSCETEALWSVVWLYVPGAIGLRAPPLNYPFRGVS